MKRLLSFLFSLLLLVQPALAAQNAVEVPTTAPLSGMGLINDINAAAQTFATLSSGPSAPTASGLGLTSTAGVIWHDTGTNTLKVRNQADTAWIVLGSFNETNGTFTPVSGWTEATVGTAQSITAASSSTNLVSSAALTATMAQSTTLGQTFALRIDAAAGAVTLTPYATDKITVGAKQYAAGASVIVPLGMVAEVITDANGNLYMTLRPGALGTATLASSATVDLGAAGAGVVTVTGTTTISSFGASAQAGQAFDVVFSGALTLTYNATSLVLPTGTNIAVAAGDAAHVVALGGGNFQITSYQPASGRSLVGASSAALPAGFKNLAVTVTSGTALTVAADAIVVTDGSANYSTLTSVSHTISTGTTGANGLDTGALAASTWYAVWEIYNPTAQTKAAMLSLSATAPTMPSGYAQKARMGWVLTNASSVLVGTIQRGRQAQYVVGGTNLTALPIIISGSQGSPTTPTWIAAAVGGFVPSTASKISLALSLPATSATVMAAPNNSYGTYNSTTNPPPMVLSLSSGTGTVTAELMLESTNVYFASNTANGKLLALGWEDNI